MNQIHPSVIVAVGFVVFVTIARYDSKVSSSRPQICITDMYCTLGFINARN